MKTRQRSSQRGATLIYMLVMMTALIGFASLGVDVAHVRIAKAELQRTADAAALYGATVCDVQSTARAYAKDAANDNTVDGSAVILKNADIETGTWDSATKTFTAGGPNRTAIHVTAQLLKSRGTGIQLSFARLFGFNTFDLTAEAVATHVDATNTVLTAPSNGNPWLAGMPNGTTANGYDAAPANSPAQVTGISILPGSNLTFSFTGSASYYPGTQPFDPDGNPSWIINNYSGREHGKSNLNAPLTAVVGVFLNDTQPNLAGTAPADLDFSTIASRDFASLSPQLRQPFFIGNGLRNDGTTLQTFVVPVGATRFYLGIMDGQQWSDNAGSLTSTVIKPAQNTLAK